MEAAFAVERKSSVLAASSRFKGFRSEPLHDVRIHEVRSDPILEEMKKIWIACKYEKIVLWHNAKILARISDLEYSAKDVENFSMMLALFQNESDFSDNSGSFLSALMCKCREDNFVIHTSHLSELIGKLGYRNTKNFTVDGDVGRAVGEEMKAGTIIVNGNAGEFVGYKMSGGAITVEKDAGEFVGCLMQGGKIVVKGNAGDRVGNGMWGGTIIVKGNAGDEICRFHGGDVTVEGNVGRTAGSIESGTLTIGGDAGPDVGHWMKGGEIHLNGDYERISKNVFGGKIFHKGVRVFPKPYP